MNYSYWASLATVKYYYEYLIALFPTAAVRKARWPILQILKKVRTEEYSTELLVWSLIMTLLIYFAGKLLQKNFVMPELWNKDPG